MDTGDQEHFDECESVMSDALRCIRSSAFEWKVSFSCAYLSPLSLPLALN